MKNQFGGGLKPPTPKPAFKPTDRWVMGAIAILKENPNFTQDEWIADIAALEKEEKRIRTSGRIKLIGVLKPVSRSTLKRYLKKIKDAYLEG